MKNKEKLLEQICKSYMNGNISQALEQIEEYGFDEFTFALKAYWIEEKMKVEILCICVRVLADKAGVK